MFTRLRVKLTFLYAGLFGLAIILIAVALYAAVSRNAVRMVRGELDASGGVFERLWALKDEQLRDGAGLLSRDFGFLSAIATHDTPTIVSSLDNLKSRFGLDLAFMIGVDGQTIGIRQSALGQAGGDLFKSLDEANETSGVILIKGVPYQAVAAPVLSPTLMGWVVFATQLDEARMQSFEKLSAIPLDATVVTRDRKGGWVMSGAADDGNQKVIDDFVSRSLRDDGLGTAELASPDGPAIAIVKPLRTLSQRQPAALLLQYPLARALAPYRSLLETIALVGVAGLIALAWGSWILARGVTRPLSALAAAARRLQDGEDASVPVSSRDELGHLAESFNAMAAGIRARERKVAHLALHDHDTGLPNRVSLERDVATLLKDKGDGLVVVAALGVDRFAHVRGAIGYALSNILVAEIGQRLTAPAYQAVRLATDTVGVAFRAASLEAARRIVSRAQAALDRPLNVDGSDVDISLTIGLAAAPTHADEAGMLVDRAIIALDQARSAKQKLSVFSDALYGDPAANLSLMSEMLSAAETGELDLHFQPKYDLRARKVSGMEALVRWNHSRRGPLSPELFVGMAEETGHIRQLTDWVMRRAVDAQRALHQAGHDLSVSINISARLLGEADFADEALAVVTKAVGKVCFEITETAVIDDPHTALALIDRFAAAGVDISIDDYGSGLSSLAYLKQIHAHELKIDKQFVFTMGESQKDALLVRSTIDLAHSLGLKVTAEGVETDIACSLLAAMGCDYAQGFLIARPMPLARLLAFLSEDRRAEPQPDAQDDPKRQSGTA